MAEEQLWLGRNGERFGPYGDALVRQWLAEGKLEWSTLAWRSGMADWLPLSQILQAETATFSQSPPLHSTASRPAFRHLRREHRRSRTPSAPA